MSVNYFKFTVTNGGINLKLNDIEEKSDLPQNKQIAIIEKNIDRIQNHEYLLLFYQLNNESNIIWEYNQTENKFKLVEKIDDSGTFALTMPFVNLLNKARIVQKFEEDFFSGMLKEAEEKEKINKKLNEILLYSEMMETADSELIPFANVEYLIETGRRIENEIKNRLQVEFKDQNISILVKQFWNLISISLKEYDAEFGTEYYKKFENFGLTKKIKEDQNFMDQLCTSIRGSLSIEE